MTRIDASEKLRNELDKHGLQDWSVRLNQNADSRFLGLCIYKDKTIVLSAHHIDIHPDPDVINTIRHEVAHALCPGHGHDEVWSAKAKEVGCDNTLPCSSLSLSPDIIDAIRSGATIEVTFDEHVVRVPKYNITRLQDKCDVCGKVAVTKSEQVIENKDEAKPNLKIIELECGHTILKNIPKGTPFHLFQMGGNPDCKHKWNLNTCIACGRKRPFPFQLEGMKFLEAGLSVNKGAATFDDMGLGKTIQAGGVIKFHPEWWPVLWVVKATLTYQTASFCINWMGKEFVPQIIEKSDEWLIPGLKNYIISYDMLVPKVKKLKSGKTSRSGFDIEQFNRVGIKLVVLDECQQIKNVDSSRTQMVRKVVANRKVLPMSGTPWNNRGGELFPVMNMMDPRKFPSEAGFQRQWVDMYWQGNQQKQGGIKNIERFREYTKDICIRRERSVVMPELPLVNRTKLNIKMSVDDEVMYDQAVEDFVKWYQDQQGEISGIHILAAMSKMRHLSGLAKIEATKEYVAEFVEDTDRKLVIFAHHIDVQDILYYDLKALYENEMPVFRIVASMSGEQKFEVVNQFNASKRALLVASQQAAGEGLNMQTCADCVMHERQWNPGREQQCEDRFARIGQEAASVNAIYAQLEGITSIDQQFDVIVENKRYHYHKTMNKTEIQKWSEESIGKELAQVIVNAHNAKKNRQILAATGK